MILCPNGMVTPLISLSLIGPMKSTALNVSSTQMQLQHRCVKRQIAGLLIHSVPHSDVTQIKTSLGRYTVQDTSPSSEDSFIALITPSTNITISLPSQPSSDNPSATHTKQKISPVATEILHTLQLLRLLSPLSIHLPRAFLLTGPPGVGKTHAVRTAMNLSPHTTLQSIRASELLSSHTNPAIALTKLFSAPSSKSHCHLCCVFIDECDALLSHPAIPPALATLLDNLPPNFIVIAATNRIDAFPSFLTRPGRLDCHIALAPPTATQRFDILTSLLQQSQCTLQDEHVIELAHTCVGYVPADLMSLVRRAAFLASSSSSNLSTPSLEDNTPIITLDLLQNALNDVGASALRDAALSAPPKTSWDDIAGDAGGAKTSLQQAVIWPLTKQAAFQSLGLVPPRGILLHGPPGCAKTTLARAAAGASNIAFFSLAPADVYASSYVGMAEATVRRAFSLARSAAPCILFFDEIDSIVGSSGSSSSPSSSNIGMGRGNSAEARVLSTFLNEMDGVDGSIQDGVLVLGATNRPSSLDAALLRPGRFDKVIYVPNPDREARKLIFRSQCQKWKVSPSSSSLGINDEFDIDYLASDDVSGFMTGAEIVGACREAAMMAIREYTNTLLSIHTAKLTYVDEKDNISNGCLCFVRQMHVEQALKAVHPLLSDKSILERYSSFQQEQHSS
mmetsp:Transcript_38908/g.56798  ORF Transcript_38908/g.56798 Transcript_38908/m.56798 type:complete len:678 (-) Transcript_38908:168-2201(-)